VGAGGVGVSSQGQGRTDSREQVQLFVNTHPNPYFATKLWNWPMKNELS